MSLMLTFRPEAVPGLTETYGLEIDGRPFTVAVNRGAVNTARGAPASPVATIRTTARALVALLRGETGPADERIEVEGDAAALERFAAAFGPAAR